MADQQALYAFAQWVASCSGNEKQEAQPFVQKLLTAWGWEDATEAGVSFEHKIPKGGEGGGEGLDSSGPDVALLGDSGRPRSQQRQRRMNAHGAASRCPHGLVGDPGAIARP
jgi:hypothetical protein